VLYNTIECRISCTNTVVKRAGITPGLHLASCREKSFCSVLGDCKSLSLCVGRPVYVSAVRPQSKHIVVIIDHGASVTETQLQIARDAALIILNSIDEHDKVRK